MKKASDKIKNRKKVESKVTKKLGNKAMQILLTFYVAFVHGRKLKK